MTFTTKQDIWFSGPVKDAITLVAENNAVFLVYIHDDSEKTNTLNTTLKDENVIKAIKEHTVALAMENGSENAILFGQCYPIQAVPILYFIKQGTIRDFGVENLSSQEIVDKINAVSQTASIPSPAPVPETAVEHDNVPTTTPATGASTASIEPETSSPKNNTDIDQLDIKKQKLQNQLEKARKERQEREEQEAKEREIKRRNEAKLMQEAKQTRADRENKIYFDKIKKERQEDEAHRKKVREQIARDRAEKIAQRNKEKQRTASPTSETSTNGSSSGINHSVSNLNIRQLDGSNIRHKFEATSTLSSVRDWIQENRTDDARKPYKLASQFPTRLFTETDDNSTLKELNLCPSATIIMKPLKTASISSMNSGNPTNIISHSFGVVYGILIALLNMLSGFLATLFPTGGSASHQLPQVSPHRSMTGGQRLGGESSTTASSTARKNDDTSSPDISQRRNPYGTRVNTLQDEEDILDDDEKKPTYNGNSVNHE